MSYKVLSLRTRNKIVQFCHEALQQTTFLTQHQPLPLSCSKQPGGQSISIPTHPQLSQETTKPLLSPSQRYGYKLQDHLPQRLQKSLKMRCHRIMRSLAGQQIISVKHLACSSREKGNKSSDTASSCSGRNYWVLIFRNATLTRWMAELNHLQIQQAEKQYQHAIECPKHPDSTQYINYTKN